VNTIFLPELDSINPNCGVMAPIDLSNKERLMELMPGDMFFAASFPIYVTSVTGNGIFNGEGYMIASRMLKKLKIRVKLEDVVINTDHQRIAGGITAVYDAENNLMADLGGENITIIGIINRIIEIINKIKDDPQSVVDDIEEFTKEIEEKRKKSNDSIVNNAMDKIAEVLQTTSATKEEKGSDEAVEYLKGLSQDFAEGITKSLNEHKGEITGASHSTSASNSFFDGALHFTRKDFENLPIVLKSIEHGMIDTKTGAINDNNNNKISTLVLELDLDDKLLLYTTSETPQATIDLLKNKFNNALASKDYALWLHYDVTEDALLYKIELSDKIYGKINGLEKDEIKDYFIKSLSEKIETSNIDREILSKFVSWVDGTVIDLKDVLSTVDDWLHNDYKLPKYVWNPEDPHFIFPLITPFNAGIIDQLIVEGVGVIVDLPKLIFKLITNHTEVIEAFRNIDIETIVEEFRKEREDLYSNQSISVIQYQTGKDVVTVAGLVMVGKAVISGAKTLTQIAVASASQIKKYTLNVWAKANKYLKEGYEIVEEGGELVAKKGSAIIKIGEVIRENWNGFTNIFKANADEIAEAAAKIKNYRTANNLKSGNYGYLEGKVNGKNVENKMWRSIPIEEADKEIHIFQAVETKGKSGTWLRITDSEYRMLNKLADDLGGKLGTKYPNVTGELKIISENPFCTSCQGVIQDFNEMFPNIKLILIDGVK
jgi:hypothetical protein